MTRLSHQKKNGSLNQFIQFHFKSLAQWLRTFTALTVAQLHKPQQAFQKYILDKFSPIPRTVRFAREFEQRTSEEDHYTEPDRRLHWAFSSNKELFKKMLGNNGNATSWNLDGVAGCEPWHIHTAIQYRKMKLTFQIKTCTVKTEEGLYTSNSLLPTALTLDFPSASLKSSTYVTSPTT